MTKEIEDQLRAAIVQSKLSYQELMRLSGVSHSIISRFANHQRTITMTVASKIAKALSLELIQKGKSE